MASRLSVFALKKVPLSRFSTAAAVHRSSILPAPETDVSQLSNGLRVVSENWNCPTCTVGVLVNAGSRAETDANNGVSHFLEHMIFKGTTSRTHEAVEADVEKRGASLSAFTTRELAGYYAKCHVKDVPWAVELLADFIKNSKFEESHLEKERKHILNDLREAESNHKEVVFDYLHGTAYQGSSLSHAVLGREENIKNLKASDLRSFIEQNYKPSSMVLCAAGGIEHQKLIDAAGKHFGDSHQSGPAVTHPPGIRFSGGDIRDRDDAHDLAHGVIAFEGPIASSNEVIPMMVATCVHGSWDRTSGGAFNVASDLAARFYGRDKMIHSFEHFFLPYRDTSLWGAHVTCGKLASYEGVWFIQEEWINMATSIRESAVQRAKNALKSQLLLANSGTTALFKQIGQHMMHYDRRIPLPELLARIDDVNAEQVRQVLMKYTYDRCPAVACFGPIEAFPDYSEIRSHTWWVRY